MNQANKNSTPATHPEDVRGARKRIHATHRDFTPFTRPRSRAQRRVAQSDRLRYERDLAVFRAPETLTDLPSVRRVEVEGADAL
jgi:hypothetical protein